MLKNEMEPNEKLKEQVRLTIEIMPLLVYEYLNQYWNSIGMYCTIMNMRADAPSPNEKDGPTYIKNIGDGVFVTLPVGVNENKPPHYGEEIFFLTTKRLPGKRHNHRNFFKQENMEYQIDLAKKYAEENNLDMLIVQVIHEESKPSV